MGWAVYVVSFALTLGLLASLVSMLTCGAFGLDGLWAFARFHFSTDSSPGGDGVLRYVSPSSMERSWTSDGMLHGVHRSDEAMTLAGEFMTPQTADGTEALAIRAKARLDLSPPDHPGATEDLTACIRSGNDSAGIRHLRAKCRMELDPPDVLGALRDADLAISWGINTPDVRLLRARARIQTGGSVDEVAKDLDQASLDPELAPEAQAFLALVLWEQEEEEAASTASLRAISDPGHHNALALAVRSLVLADRGERRKALQLAERSLAVDDDLAFGHWVTARVWLYRERPDFVRAHHHLSKAITLDPTWIPSRIDRTICTLDMEGGDLHQAIADCSRVLEVVPHDQDTLAMRAVARFRLAGRRTRDAMLDLQRAEATDKEGAFVLAAKSEANSVTPSNRAIAYLKQRFLSHPRQQETDRAVDST